MSVSQLLDQHFGTIEDPIVENKKNDNQTDRTYDYPLGTVVRAGEDWGNSNRFVFLGETEFEGETCPVLMRKNHVANSMDKNPDIHIAEPDTEIKWASDNPPKAYTKRLKKWADGQDETWAKYSYPSNKRVDTEFSLADQKPMKSVSPGDIVDYDGDEYLYCGKHKDRWVMAANDESCCGASLSKEDIDSDEYVVDIVEPKEVKVKRSKFKPDVAHQIHKRTINNPRFGREVKVKYKDYDSETTGRWVGNYNDYSSMVAVKSGDRFDPDERMELSNTLNHPDDNEQHQIMKVEDERIKLGSDMPSPEEIQYYRRMLKIPPNKRDMYAGKFKNAYLKTKN